MSVNSLYIKQGDKNIVVTFKTVDWLVNNTQTSEFNPVDFTGYQRKIDDKHCDKIVDYLMKSFYMPATIICAIHSDYDENAKLYIVDGQHRIKAFSIIKDKNKDRYDAIKNEQIPVVVLVNPLPETEISTFITINKTAKKVDTSLAFVLKNKLNAEKISDDLMIPRREYISVESAWKINNNVASIWKDRILFENSPSALTKESLSLNAWVKSIRVLLGCFERHKLITYKWETKEDIDELVDKTINLIDIIWDTVKNKWNELFDLDEKNYTIIQGAIGFNAIHKLVIHTLDFFQSREVNVDNNVEIQPVKNSIIDLECYKKLVNNAILSNKSVVDDWKPSGRYSSFSSESGYTLLGNELIKLSI